MCDEIIFVLNFATTPKQVVFFCQKKSAQTAIILWVKLASDHKSDRGSGRSIVLSSLERFRRQLKDLLLSDVQACAEKRCLIVVVW